jgi:hypothetical protein
MITLFIASLAVTTLFFLGAPLIAFALMLETCESRGAGALGSKRRAPARRSMDAALDLDCMDALPASSP